MHIRKALSSDLSKLTELFDGYRIFYKQPSDTKAAARFIGERILRADSEIFVAELTDESLGGFVQLYSIFSSVRMRRLWLLNDLFVSPLHRGIGIGMLFIEKAKELAVSTSACGLILETEKSNEIGNTLYPKAGFNLETDHNYYFWNSLPQ